MVDLKKPHCPGADKEVENVGDDIKCEKPGAPAHAEPTTICKLNQKKTRATIVNEHFVSKEVTNLDISLLDLLSLPVHLKLR